MSETKHSMSAKGFLHRASGKAANAALGFIAAHRAWLETGELSAVTSPILAKIDSKELLPTPGLDAIKKVVFDHMITQESKKAAASLDRSANPSEHRSSKPVEATVYNVKGEIVSVLNEKTDEYVDLVKNFDRFQDAKGWCDLRLIDCEPGCHAEVKHSKLIVKGAPLTEIITREDAFARIFKKGKSPLCKVTGVSTSKLSFGQKCKNDHFNFSKG